MLRISNYAWLLSLKSINDHLKTLRLASYLLASLCPSTHPLASVCLNPSKIFILGPGAFDSCLTYEVR